MLALCTGRGRPGWLWGFVAGQRARTLLAWPEAPATPGLSLRPGQALSQQEQVGLA